MKRDCHKQKQRQPSTENHTQRSGDGTTRCQAFSTTTICGYRADDHFSNGFSCIDAMCKDIGLFDSINDSRVKIRVANKQYIQAKECGTINILVNINGKLVPKQLKDVLSKA